MRLAAATALTTSAGAPAGATAVRPSAFMAIWAGGGGGSEEKPPEAVGVCMRGGGAGQQGGAGRGCGEPASGQGGLHGCTDSGFAFQSASEVS